MAEMSSQNEAKNDGSSIYENVFFPQVDVLWMQVVFFIFSLFVFTVCLYAGIFIRWVYKRRMNEKTEEMVEQYKKEERRRKELDLILKRQEMIQNNQLNMSNPQPAQPAQPQQIQIITTPCPNQFQHTLVQNPPKPIGYRITQVDEQRDKSASLKIEEKKVETKQLENGEQKPKEPENAPVNRIVKKMESKAVQTDPQVPLVDSVSSAQSKLNMNRLIDRLRARSKSPLSPLVRTMSSQKTKTLSTSRSSGEASTKSGQTSQTSVGTTSEPQKTTTSATNLEEKKGQSEKTSEKVQSSQGSNEVIELKTPPLSNPRALYLFPYYVDPATKSPDVSQKVENAKFVNPKDSASCTGEENRSSKFYAKGGKVYKNSSENSNS